MEYFNFQFPIDLASAFIGGLIGLALVLIFEFFTKPRIYPWDWKFIKEDFNLGFSADPGINYKIIFKISGLRSPGFCEVKIRWCGNIVRAKWDEAPNPLSNDNPKLFTPELVPQTYLNTVMLKEFYSVPIFNIDPNNKITIFDGWWFGKRLGLPYGPHPEVNKNAKVEISIKGNELDWNKEFHIANIIENIN